MPLIARGNFEVQLMVFGFNLRIVTLLIVPLMNDLFRELQRCLVGKDTAIKILGFEDAQIHRNRIQSEMGS